MTTKIVTFALACASAGMFMAPQAHAQCPTDDTRANPLLILANGGGIGLLNPKWTYDMGGSLPGGAAYAAAGQFTASSVIVNGFPKGRLTITQTSSDGARQEVDGGSYQINSDCSGGTLTFTLSQRYLQFDFWFDENFGEIRFVASTPGVAVRGTAERFGTILL